MVRKYRKKPVVIEAIIWNGNNNNEVNDFLNYHKGSGKVLNRKLRIKTLTGAVWAGEGDYIVKGVQDEFYPCKPDIFKKTYEDYEEETP